MAPGRSYGSGNNEERITVSRPKPRPQMKTSDTGSNSEPQVILVEFLSIQHSGGSWSGVYRTSRRVHQRSAPGRA